VNKQCFADGDAGGSSGVTGAALRAVDPVVRIKSTGARPIDAMSAWATTGGPGTASLVASGRVTGCAFYATCSSSLPTPTTPACNASRRTDLPRRTWAVLSRGCPARSAHFPTAPDGLTTTAARTGGAASSVDLGTVS
jgi:hypothetical protein